MKRFLLLLSCSGVLLCGAELASVHSVYLMPMPHGLDQYLANRLTASHAFQVVTDPKLADAVFTDRIGEAFLAALEQASPTPKPAVEETKEEDKSADKSADKSGEKTGEEKTSTGPDKLDNPALRSVFGKGKGTVFLVDAKSREVVWSTFQVPAGAGMKQMDRTASDIVSRLMKDLKKK